MPIASDGNVLRKVRAYVTMVVYKDYETEGPKIEEFQQTISNNVKDETKTFSGMALNGFKLSSLGEIKTYTFNSDGSMPSDLNENGHPAEVSAPSFEGLAKKQEEAPASSEKLEDPLANGSVTAPTNVEKSQQSTSPSDLGTGAQTTPSPSVNIAALLSKDQSSPPKDETGLEKQPEADPTPI